MKSIRGNLRAIRSLEHFLFCCQIKFLSHSLALQFSIKECSKSQINFSHIFSPNVIFVIYMCLHAFFRGTYVAFVFRTARLCIIFSTVLMWGYVLLAAAAVATTTLLGLELNNSRK